MKLKICSWNVQWGRGRDGRVDLARTADELKSLDADVVCLQEVAVNHPGLPGKPAGDQAAALGAMLPGHEAIYAAGSDLTDGRGGRRQFGELVLSRFAVLQVFRHRLPWPADPAVPSMPRVALEAVIATPAGPLRVVTTHLEFYSRRQREAQVEALRRLYVEGWLDAQCPRSSADTDPPFAVLARGERAVICGDFNFTPASAEYAQLQRAFDADVAAPPLVDAWSALHPRVPHPPTAGLSPSEFVPVPSCFDFFFISENLAANLAGISVDHACAASDHQPVILELNPWDGNKVSIMTAK